MSFLSRKKYTEYVNFRLKRLTSFRLTSPRVGEVPVSVRPLVVNPGVDRSNINRYYNINKYQIIIKDIGFYSL